MLVGEDDEDVELNLDKFTAEWLMGALAEFLMQGESDDMPSISIGRR
ncbi:hypothetical protein [Mesorhizobium sp. 131-2-1]|nr:hypothetical protein [Mesorhizobium sp. 131-2-1]